MRLIWKRKYNIDDETLEKNILEIEKTYKIKFPKLYREMMRNKATDVLSEEVMEKGYKHKTHRYEINFESFDFNAEYNIKKANIKSRDVRPKEFIFWGTDAGGNAYGFDFKDNPDNPKIVYYNHDVVPPRSDLRDDGVYARAMDEKQRACYEVRYDSIEEMYPLLEIAQEYWIKEEFGSKDSDEYKEYVAIVCD